MRTTAVREPDGQGYRLSGRKVFSSAGPVADFAIVIARMDGTEKTYSAFLVDLDSPGCQVLDGAVPMSGEHIESDILLSDCRVPAANLLGAEGDGLLLGLGRVNVNRLLHCPSVLGMARRALELTLERVGTRTVAGAPLAELQSIQHKLADMATSYYAARAMTYAALAALDTGTVPRLEAFMCKLNVAESAFRILDEAVQIHGKEGLTQGNEVEFLFRKVRMFRVLTGTSRSRRTASPSCCCDPRGERHEPVGSHLVLADRHPTGRARRRRAAGRTGPAPIHPRRAGPDRMTAAPLRAATAFGAIASGDTATGGRALRRTLAVLLLIVLFSGFQQSYFTSLFQALGDRYHVGVSALAWTVTGPALTAAIATPLLAALGDRHGHLRVLRATTAAVAAGAVLIALAPDYPLLMAGRMLQGCLAGFLPLMSGLVRRRHGIRHTHRAIAYLSAALMFGVLLGSACSSLLLRTAASAPCCGHRPSGRPWASACCRGRDAGTGWSAGTASSAGKRPSAWERRPGSTGPVPRCWPQLWSPSRWRCTRARRGAGARPARWAASVRAWCCSPPGRRSNCAARHR